MKHNWEYKKLREVCVIKTGKLDANAKVENGQYPFFTCDAKPYRIDTFAFDTEAILISGNGSNVGYVHYYNGKFNAYQRTYVLSNICCFNPHYLVIFLRGFLRPYIYNKKKGGCIPFITLPMLTNFPIPVPPMAVQERIVAELDKINEVMEDCRELLRYLDTLAQSLFYDYFGDPITNPKAWEVKTLGTISTVLGGSTPKTNVDEYWNGDLCWITPAELKSEKYIYDTERHITELGRASSGLMLLPIDTVLLTSRAPIGKVAIAKVPMYCNQGFKNLICDAKQVHYQYVYSFLSLITDVLNEKGSGATFKEISKKVTEAISITVPPLPLQEKFAKDIEAIESVKATTTQQLAELQTLLDSRMDYWFN